MPDSRQDPNAAVRAAVAGAPQTPTSCSSETSDTPAAAVAATLTKANTKTTGYLGLALVLASYVVPAIVPDVDKAISDAHVPPIVVHALVALVGGVAALLGRWKCFADDPK